MNDLVVSGTVPQGAIFEPARFISNLPQVFRQARKPDGQIVIQGGYVWHEGFMSGIEWRELPIVDVDDTGNEISVDAGGAA